MFIPHGILHLQKAAQDIDWKLDALKQGMDLWMWNVAGQCSFLLYQLPALYWRAAPDFP